MKVTTLGIDLAKSVFQVHGVDERGKAVVKKVFSRSQLPVFIANLAPCLIGLEACGGAHYWARRFKEFDHTVKLMAPQFVKPYVKANKNDAHDAEAICEAVQRPSMRFVPIKSTSQQDMQCLHRIRSRLIKNQTALSNEIRGFLHEYGIVLPRSVLQLKKSIPGILEDAESELTPVTRCLLQKLYSELGAMGKEISYYETEIKELFKLSESAKRLEKINGVGVLTATMIVASVADASVFKNGRQFAAWLGLVPKHSGSGGKVQISGISKRGDKYLRQLLVHGARASLKTAEKRNDKVSQWVTKKKELRGYNKACVALANKNARIMWAMLRYGTDYRAA
jgi:transposase